MRKTQTDGRRELGHDHIIIRTVFKKRSYKNEIVPVLTDIIDCIFKDLDVPAFLKCGILTPIHKKGKDKFLTNSYRGIVVSNVFARIIESVLKDR